MRSKLSEFIILRRGTALAATLALSLVLATCDGSSGDVTGGDG